MNTFSLFLATNTLGEFTVCCNVTLRVSLGERCTKRTVSNDYRMVAMFAWGQEEGRDDGRKSKYEVKKIAWKIEVISTSG